jgi:co-chaperonin GroES (HSP10)
VKYNEILGHPANDRLLVELIDIPEKTAGGIHIALSTRQNLERTSGRGIIVDAGLSARDTMRSYKWEIGDQVTFGKFAPVYMAGTEWDDAEGRNHRGIILVIGDVFTNVSMAARLNAGTVKIEFNHEIAQHVAVAATKNGATHAIAV